MLGGINFPGVVLFNLSKVSKLLSRLRLEVVVK